MPQSTRLSRRQFVKSSSALAATSSLLTTASAKDTDTSNHVSLKGRIYKTLKIGMVKVEGSLSDKFNAVKKSGFAGIEMNAPGMDVEETKRAIADSGLPVDGTVCSTHWSIRHTSPQAAERANALQDLQAAIRDTHAVGGHTALLGIGHGRTVRKRKSGTVRLATLPKQSRWRPNWES